MSRGEGELGPLGALWSEWVREIMSLVYAIHIMA